MKRAALISVSDRTNLSMLAQALQKLGFELLTTSGSGKYLKEQGISSTAIETYIAQKEILGGRVKTLHPRIYAGILARRDNPEDMQQIEADNILSIDVVAVNLYPFAQGLKEKRSLNEMIELVDIGGPSMIRAAAKNHRFVYPVIDPQDYGQVVEFLERGESAESEKFRRHLASKVFVTLAADNATAANYFSSVDEEEKSFAGYTGLALKREQRLRYGENPHQQGAFYMPLQGAHEWQQLGGKELSYNNLLDLDAACELLRALSKWNNPTAVILKHLNPCGAAYGPDLLSALKLAKRSDPRSHFGGILGFNSKVSKEVAAEVREDFAEIVVAPAFEAEALSILQKSKALRIIQADFSKVNSSFEYRSVMGGMLIQELDTSISDVRSAELVSDRKPSTEEWEDLSFAWTLCARVKSNAIVVAKGGVLLGTGAGQMSRIDSVEVALSKAKLHQHDLNGAVAASDAFFPFPDGLETLAAAGIKAIIAPGGAKRDEEVIASAKKFGVSLLFATDRHFRH